MPNIAPSHSSSVGGEEGERRDESASRLALGAKGSPSFRAGTESEPRTGNYQSSARKKRGVKFSLAGDRLHSEAHQEQDRAAARSPDNTGYTEFNEQLNEWKRAAQA